MPRFSRGVLRLLGVLAVVALLQPVPSMLQAGKPDDNFGSVECKRCKDSCNEARDACDLRCLFDCNSEFAGDPAAIGQCVAACNEGCTDGRVLCHQLCKPLCQGISETEP